MRKLPILLMAVFAVHFISEAPAYASGGILDNVGTTGIVAIVVVVGICTYLMKRFMG